MNIKSAKFVKSFVVVVFGMVVSSTAFASSFSVDDFPKMFLDGFKRFIFLLGNGSTNTVSPKFVDNFDGYSLKYYLDGESFGSWLDVFGGYGSVGIESDGSNNFLHLSPKIADSSDKTYSSLVTDPSYSGAITFESKIMTVAQLRTRSTPNAWEVAWVVWNYSDNDHFYYFITKPNGWELGKRDSNYPGEQRFLSTGDDKLFPIGNWYNVKITQDSSNLISVWVDGSLITTFTDKETPYTSGNIGFYTEDAHVHVDDVKVWE